MSVVSFFFFSSRRRHTRSLRDWSSDVCSSDLPLFSEWGSIQNTRSPTPKRAAAIKRTAIMFLLHSARVSGSNRIQCDRSSVLHLLCSASAQKKKQKDPPRRTALKTWPRRRSSKQQAIESIVAMRQSASAVPETELDRSLLESQKTPFEKPRFGHRTSRGQKAEPQQGSPLLFATILPSFEARAVRRRSGQASHLL